MKNNRATDIYKEKARERETCEGVYSATTTTTTTTTTSTNYSTSIGLCI